MTVSSVLLVLLQVCSLHLMAVAMPTCKLEGKLLQMTHNLVRDVGEVFPAHCLPYNANISFPRSAFPAVTTSKPECRQASWVVYESLQGVGQILEDYDAPIGEGGATWEDQKFAKFQHLQERLLEQGSCLSRVNGSEVSSYFSHVTAALEQQDSAACGWMALWRDLLWVLKTALRTHYEPCFTWRHSEGRGHAH